MKQALRYLLGIIFFVTPFVSHAEYIKSFDAEIVLNDDSSFVVTETINYVFSDEKHGIFRYVPTKHPQASSVWYKERYTEIEVEEILMDGEEVPYEVKKERSRIFIKIGDPDTTITGEHTYVITYTVEGGVSYRPITELYWNVTGEDWPVGMENVTATLIADGGLLASERACYRGLGKSTASCATTIGESDRVTFSTVRLGPSEGLTIAQGLNPARLETHILERTETIFFWAIGLFVWFLGLIWFVVNYKTENRTGSTIIPQYEPYPGVKPMYAGLLMDGRLDARDITACIVYLAEQGFLKIKKIEKKVLFFFEVDDYQISLEKIPDTLSLFEKNILALLLREPHTIGKTISLGELKKDLYKQKENLALLTELKKDLEVDLESSGFFQVVIPTHLLLGGGVATLVIGIFLANTLFDAGGQLLLIFGALVLSIIIIAFMYRRRTRKGYEALDHLRGFKEFLSVTDTERYEFHNAPEKSPEQFLEYLPYAIAFGVEEKWAEVFKDITIPNPGWYDGGSAGTFSAVNLSSSIGAFSTAFAASSGTSASSGGGSVGGGGGGGGGGSW